MMSKLWNKGFAVNQLIEDFTVGKDREMDLFLAPYDVLGSMAHITMLESINLLEKEDLKVLLPALHEIYQSAKANNFTIEEGVEDVHSQVEMLLTQRVGEAGKKIHSGRSRNDQVLVDLKLFMRAEIQEIVELTHQLFSLLIEKSEQYKDTLLPGYTHLQVAMPSSFGLWFGAYAESLIDDLHVLHSGYKICNQNPLGSAAGYGSSFPLNRQMTTDLLGFDSMNYNVVYAQMGRGKSEKIVGFGLSSVAATLGKLAYDVCLYMSQNFNFVSLPKELTTGSSIMPHKKNPDVFELLRSHCNKIQGLPAQILLMINNLPSGYFRDLQLVKELIVPAFDDLKNCLNITLFAIEHMTVNPEILNDQKYDLLFSVDEVNRRVLEGETFRDAYLNVGKEIMEGKFDPPKNVAHTHEGSIGNLCNDKIVEKFDQLLNDFNFQKTEKAIQELISQSI
ncbi:argininosuccinate lyase [Prolixibacteraceae bacterium JC049]|nr:argininosuccinate lyase [Prolixibacteraceae bacterium JC049]